jgi:cyclopropane fatty-acyl-phospholipid synthase-like methyltransferase
MQPARDPKVNYKHLVAAGYDACAAAYEEARGEALQPEIKWLKKQLPNQAAVLDIGCGCGLPVTRELAKRFVVTGVDISAEQIRRARRHVRHATFLHCDILALDFPLESFDAVTAFYVIFHLPLGDQARLFKNIRGWLKPGGYLLATLSNEAQEPYTEDDFFGAKMYWSNFGMREYEVMLADAGFKLLNTARLGSGYTLAAPPESHPLVIAQVSS